MTVKVAINGFGRIGRNVCRALFESGRTDVEIVCINDLAPLETNRVLLQYDSVHGTFPFKVERIDEDTIIIDGHKIDVVQERDPASLPWKELRSVDSRTPDCVQCILYDKLSGPCGQEPE